MNALSVLSGIDSTSRLGLRGSERISESLRVSFILESGFETDSGAFKDSGTFFDREASISLEGPYGKLSAGRLGMLRGGVSSAGMLGGSMSPFGTSWGTYIQGMSFATSKGNERVNNSLLYRTPVFSGLDARLQYSLANTSEGASANADGRYMALALHYKRGAFAGQLILDTTNLSRSGEASHRDPASATLSAKYDFGPVTACGTIHAFKDSPLKKLSDITAGSKGLVYDGCGLIAGLKARAGAGRVLAMAGYARQTIGSGWSKGRRYARSTQQGTEVAAGLKHTF